MYSAAQTNAWQDILQQESLSVNFIIFDSLRICPSFLFRTRLIDPHISGVSMLSICKTSSAALEHYEQDLLEMIISGIGVGLDYPEINTLACFFFLPLRPRNMINGSILCFTCLRFQTHLPRHSFPNLPGFRRFCS